MIIHSWRPTTPSFFLTPQPTVRPLRTSRWPDWSRANNTRNIDGGYSAIKEKWREQAILKMEKKSQTYFKKKNTGKWKKFVSNWFRKKINFLMIELSSLWFNFSISSRISKIKNFKIISAFLLSSICHENGLFQWVNILNSLEFWNVILNWKWTYKKIRINCIL